MESKEGLQPVDDAWSDHAHRYGAVIPPRSGKAGLTNSPWWTSIGGDCLARAITALSSSGVRLPGVVHRQLGVGGRTGHRPLHPMSLMGSGDQRGVLQDVVVRASGRPPR